MLLQLARLNSVVHHEELWDTSYNVALILVLHQTPPVSWLFHVNLLLARHSHSQEMVVAHIHKEEHENRPMPRMLPGHGGWGRDFGEGKSKPWDINLEYSPRNLLFSSSLEFPSELSPLANHVAREWEGPGDGFCLVGVSRMRKNQGENGAGPRLP